MFVAKNVAVISDREEELRIMWLNDVIDCAIHLVVHIDFGEICKISNVLMDFVYAQRSIAHSEY